MKKRRNITSYIVIAMILGIAVGYGCHSAFPDPAIAKEIAGYVSLLSDVFLRLIKMIIAPLVFATLTVGIAHMGDTGAVGRVGVKALGWFFIASFTSLLLGLLAATLLQPGSHLSLPLPATDAAVNLKTSAFTLKDFVIHLVPKSIAEAMANNEILQIVVFSIFFGTALSALGDAGKRLTGVIEDLAQVMLKVTGAVMWFAPVAVFAALASTITTEGLGILLTFAKFMGSFYIALALLWGVLTLAGLVFLGKRTFTLIRLIREPFLLSFATASSEAAYPKLLDALDRFGVNRKISSFVLPIGYSFNLDGSMMYCTFAVLFIAQVRRSPAARHADHDAVAADAHVEGHGGRAARIARRDRGDTQSVPPARSGPAADHGRRHVPRHGPFGDQCGRQFDRGRRRREVGGPARRPARRCRLRFRQRRRIARIAADHAARVARGRAGAALVRPRLSLAVRRSPGRAPLARAGSRRQARRHCRKGRPPLRARNRRGGGIARPTPAARLPPIAGVRRPPF